MSDKFYRFSVAIPMREKALIAWLEGEGRNAKVIHALKEAVEKTSPETQLDRLERKLEAILTSLQNGTRPEQVPAPAPQLASIVLQNMLNQLDDED